MTILIVNPVAAANARIVRTSDVPTMANFTLCGWTKIESISGGTAGMGAFVRLGSAIGTIAEKANAISLVISNRHPSEKMQINTYNWGSVIVRPNGNMGSPGMQNWFFWAMTGNARVIKSYWARERSKEWDGTQEFNVNATVAITHISHGVEMTANISANTLSMKLALVKQWNTALSSDELIEQKSLFAPVTTANLVAQYNMDGPDLASDLVREVGAGDYICANTLPLATAGIGNVSYSSDFPSVYRDSKIVITNTGSISEKFFMPTNAKGNDLQYSGNIAHALWVKSNVIVAANAGISPRGDRTAVKIMPINTNRHMILSPNLLMNVDSTISVFAKRGEYSKLGIYRLATNTGALFNLVTGTVENVSGSANSNVYVTQGNYTATISANSNGWYRCTLYLNSAGTETSNYYFAVDIGYANTFTPTGNIPEGLYVWGPQIEKGNVSTYNETITFPFVNTQYGTGNTLYLTLNNMGNVKTFNPNTEVMFE